MTQSWKVYYFFKRPSCTTSSLSYQQNRINYDLIKLWHSPLTFSWFCFRSGLVSIQSGFKRSRSLSLCFLDLFFLCWPLASCCAVHIEVPLCRGLGLGKVGAGSVLSSLEIAHGMLSLCGEYKPTGFPWGWLLVMSNSVFVAAQAFPWLEELRAPLVPQSAWEGDCRGRQCSDSLCFLGVWMLEASKTSDRF